MDTPVKTADWTTEELEVLRLFKERAPKPNSDRNLSPFDDRVARVANASKSIDCDLHEMHQDVRQRILTMIENVREGKKKSQVLLLAGAPGVGKTHLVNCFHPPEMQAEHGYIFVGGSNAWRIEEFQSQLLDWVVQAVTAPSPSDNKHQLLLRIQAIGFRAAEQLLEQPNHWKAVLARSGGLVSRFGPLARVRNWFRRPSRELLLEMVNKRNEKVFAYFDEAAFSTIICDRFLAETSNQLHRYVMRVLLTYLYPDRNENIVVSRERVLHWLAGHVKDDYFHRRFGVTLELDKKYTQFQAVKLLTHLFSKEVSEALASGGVPTKPRLLFLTFDQVEGRDELFESDDDWMNFFADLGELYGSLSNVVILFTMTLQMRNRLHSLMERQFRERIVMDEKFVLSFPTKAELLGVYHNRVADWIKSDPDTSSKYQAVSNSYLPFTADWITDHAGNQSIRSSMDMLDKAFLKTLGDIVVGPHLDLRYAVNEIAMEQLDADEWNYTVNHLDTVGQLFDVSGDILCNSFNFRIQARTNHELDGIPYLTFRIVRPNESASIMVHLARIGWALKKPLDKLVDKLLKGKNRDRNFLMVVRPTEFNYDAGRYSELFLTGLCPPDVESTFRGLIRIASNLETYSSDPTCYEEYHSLVRQKIEESYLIEFLRFVDERMEAKLSSSAEIEIVEPAQAEMEGV